MTGPCLNAWPVPPPAIHVSARRRVAVDHEVRVRRDLVEAGPGFTTGWSARPGNRRRRIWRDASTVDSATSRAESSGRSTGPSQSGQAFSRDAVERREAVERALEVDPDRQRRRLGSAPSPSGTAKCTTSWRWGTIRLAERVGKELRQPRAAGEHERVGLERCRPSSSWTRPESSRGPRSKACTTRSTTTDPPSASNAAIVATTTERRAASAPRLGLVQRPRHARRDP